MKRIKVWVGALFVDIMDSRNLFKSPNEDGGVVKVYAKERNIRESMF